MIRTDFLTPTRMPEASPVYFFFWSVITARTAPFLRFFASSYATERDFGNQFTQKSNIKKRQKLTSVFDSRIPSFFLPRFLQSDVLFNSSIDLSFSIFVIFSRFLFFLFRFAFLALFFIFLLHFNFLDLADLFDFAFSCDSFQEGFCVILSFVRRALVDYLTDLSEALDDGMLVKIWGS